MMKNNNKHLSHIKKKIFGVFSRFIISRKAILQEQVNKLRMIYKI